MRLSTIHGTAFSCSAADTLRLLLRLRAFLAQCFCFVLLQDHRVGAAGGQVRPEHAGLVLSGAGQVHESGPRDPTGKVTGSFIASLCQLAFGVLAELFS